MQEHIRENLIAWASYLSRLSFQGQQLADAQLLASSQACRFRMASLIAGSIDFARSCCRTAALSSAAGLTTHDTLAAQNHVTSANSFLFHGAGLPKAQPPPQQQGAHAAQFHVIPSLFTPVGWPRV